MGIFSPRVRLIILIGIVIVAGFWLSSWYEKRRVQLQSYEDSPRAYVVISDGSAPMLVDVRVIDLAGNPVPAIKVSIRNNSGGNSAMTDNEGRAKIKVGETEIEQVLLNGETVLNRPDAYWVGYPSVSNGVQLLIVRKGVVGTRL